MDKNETYIKMCNCPEIQNKWKPKVGDKTDKGIIISIAYNESSPSNSDCYFDNSKGIAKIGVYVKYNKNWQWLSKEEAIWLPTQEQLQKMLIKAKVWFDLVWFDLQCSVATYEVPTPDGFGYISEVVWALKLMPPKTERYIIQLCPTAEQALIQGVMQEIYQKKWDGEKWNKMFGKDTMTEGVEEI